jgi:diguanylate cyclase (GGDEF)-like protein
MVTVSVGIAEYDPASPAAGDLLDEADRAMYRAKAAGRNMVY